jgi:hypothetical protein
MNEVDEKDELDDLAFDVRNEIDERKEGNKRTGRKPLVLSDDDVAKIEKLAAYLNQDQISDVMGFSSRWLRKARLRDERIDLALRRGKSSAVGVVAKSLVKKARDGDTVSQIFFLKAQGGWQDRQVVQHEGDAFRPTFIIGGFQGEQKSIESSFEDENEKKDVIDVTPSKLIEAD